MNDRDVREQLKRMVAFIESEARDKANEIRVRAEEEFQVQKQSIEQTEKQKITKQFERQEKEVEVQRRIAVSNAINQNRLKVLKAREDIVMKLYADAKRQLQTIPQNKADYKKLLQQLVLQALLKLQEPNVLVRVREQDRDLVRDVLAPAAAAYKEKTGVSSSLSIDTTQVLNAQTCAGGVVLMSQDGRIVCDNTLDQRLALAFEKRLPEVRKMLFGASTTRRFLE